MLSFKGSIYYWQVGQRLKKQKAIWFLHSSIWGVKNSCFILLGEEKIKLGWNKTSSVMFSGACFSTLNSECIQCCWYHCNWFSDWRACWISPKRNLPKFSCSVPLAGADDGWALPDDSDDKYCWNSLWVLSKQIEEKTKLRLFKSLIWWC